MIKTKRIAVQKIEKGKPIGHPVYVEKSVWQQLWDDYIYPFLILLAGIAIGVILE